jgi:hydroxyacylglutathione hydrolase
MTGLSMVGQNLLASYAPDGQASQLEVEGVDSRQAASSAGAISLSARVGVPGWQVTRESQSHTIRSTTFELRDDGGTMKRLIVLVSVLLCCASGATAQLGGTAALTGLGLGADKSDLERLAIGLNEPFSPSTLAYTVTVDSAYTSFVYITPRVSGGSVRVAINGADATPGEAFKTPLSMGENTFAIAVGAGDRTKTYRLTVTRKDFSKNYVSEPLGKGMWRIQDFGGHVGNEDMYLVEGATRALLFDTGMGKGDLPGYVRTLSTLPVDVAITHGHRDHFGQLDQFPDATVYITAEDVSRLPAEWVTPRVKILKGGDVIDIGNGRKYEVVAIPGHSPGSVVFVDMANTIGVTGDAVSSGSMVYMFGSACTALDEYRDGLAKAEQRFKALDGLTLLVGHHYQERTPLKGAAGKQLFTDMRTAADRVLAGTLVGKVARTGRDGNTSELRQAEVGLAGLWYNPSNLVTDKAALRFLALETAPGVQAVMRPGFSSMQVKYAATVPASVSIVQVTPMAFWSGHRAVTINGAPAKSGAATRIELKEGANTIDVSVTSETGSTRTYTVAVTRAATK